MHPEPTPLPASRPPAARVRAARRRRSIGSVAAAASLCLTLPILGPADAQEPVVWRSQPQYPVVGSGEPRPPERCRIRLSSAQSGGRRSFSATEIIDLDFRVLLPPALAGEHLVHLDFHTPRGHLYQRLTVPVTADPARAGSLRPVDGYARPLAVRATEPVTVGGLPWGSVVAQLPVAGTAIVHGSLYGRWTATAFIDERDDSCGRPRAFFIEP